MFFKAFEGLCESLDVFESFGKCLKFLFVVLIFQMFWTETERETEAETEPDAEAETETATETKQSEGQRQIDGWTGRRADKQRMRQRQKQVDKATGPQTDEVLESLWKTPTEFRRPP